MALLHSDFQSLAEHRLREARALQGAGLHDGAYYLGGYAVECALKACIAKQTKQFEFPDKRRAESAWKHDLPALVKAAALAADLEARQNASAHFLLNWNVVKEWSEESRYARWSPEDAGNLLDAIDHAHEGVLPWLRLHW